MRKIITSNSQIEFQEVSSTGTLLNSIGLQLGEVYFIIKGNKVSFYLNDSEKPFDSFIWSLDIPFYLDDELIETPNDASAALKAIMNDSFQEQLDELKEGLASEEARATEAEQQLDSKIGNEQARAISAETHLQGEITSMSGTVATLDTLISGLTDDLASEIARATNAEDVLDSKIDLEIQNRINAVSGLTERVADDEASTGAALVDLNNKINAVSGENASQNVQISGLTNSINTEISRATSVENALRSDLTNETSARTTADAAQLQRITALEVGKADANNVYTKLESDNKYATKDYISGLTDEFQEKLVAGENITISGNVISAVGGGGGVTPSEVQEMIDESISGKADSDDVYTKNEVDASQNAQNSKINEISGKTDNVITDVQTLSGEVQTISGSAITSGEVQTMINKSVSGKADSNSVYTKTQSDNKYQLKGDYVTGAQMSAFTYDKATIDEKVAEGGTFDPTLYYTKTATDALLADKASTTALTAHTANTTVHVTAAEKNTWNNKSDFSGSYNDLTDKPTIPSLDGYATQSWVSGFTYDKQTIDDKIAQGGTFDPTQYYTKTATNALLDLKADTANTYTKSEVNGLVADKADTTAVTQVNNAVTAHTANTTVHITSAERTSWDAKPNVWCGDETAWSQISGSTQSGTIYLVY